MWDEGAGADVMLFAPGSDEHKLNKAAGIPGVVLIADLEDSVTYTHKELARERVRGVVSRLAPGRVIWVRINPVSQAAMWQQDLRALVRVGVGGILVPKVGGPEELRRVGAELSNLEHERGLELGTIRVMPIVETASGVVNVDRIAEADERVTALALGPGDLALELGFEPTSEASTPNPTLVFAMVRLVYASAAAHLEPPHDGAYGDFRDREGLRARARFARDLGFATKHAIHPAQVEAIRECFRPSELELTNAQRVVSAYRQAEAEGTGATALDGSLIDYPIAQRAEGILERWKASHGARL